jgi:hypothetical protein
MANRAAIAWLYARRQSHRCRRPALTRRLHQGVATIYYRGRRSRGPPRSRAAALGSRSSWYRRAERLGPLQLTFSGGADCREIFVPNIRPSERNTAALPRPAAHSISVEAPVPTQAMSNLAEQKRLERRPNHTRVALIFKRRFKTSHRFFDPHKRHLWEFFEAETE